MIFSSLLSGGMETLSHGLRSMISESTAHSNAARMAERSLRQVEPRTWERRWVTQDLMSALVISRKGKAARCPSQRVKMS